MGRSHGRLHFESVKKGADDSPKRPSGPESPGYVKWETRDVRANTAQPKARQSKISSALRKFLAWL